MLRQSFFAYKSIEQFSDPFEYLEYTFKAESEIYENIALICKFFNVTPEWVESLPVFGFISLVKKMNSMIEEQEKELEKSLNKLNTKHRQIK